MQPKTLRNSRPIFWVLLLSLVMPLLVFAPEQAFAAQLNPGETQSCIYGAPAEAGLTVRLIGCTKKVMHQATKAVSQTVANHVAPAVNILASIAVLAIGVMMMNGKAPQFDQALLTIAKIAFVTAVIANTNYFYMLVNDTIDEMISTVTLFEKADIKTFINPSCKGSAGGEFASVPAIWYGVDCMLDNIVGAILGGNITTGMVGFFAAAIFSGWLGLLVAIMGGVLIFLAFKALTQALFVYITALVSISLLIIIAPVIVPTLIFNSTRQYFGAWLGTLFKYVIQPIMLFAYMSVFLMATGKVMFTSENSVVSVITGTPMVGAFGPKVQSAIVKKTVHDMAVNVSPKNSIVDGQANVGYRGVQNVGAAPCDLSRNSLLECLNTERSLDTSQGSTTGTDIRKHFGIKQELYMLDWDKLGAGSYSKQLEILLSLITAVLTVYVFLELLARLPYIGAKISMGMGGMPFSMGSSSSTDSIVMKNVQSVFSGGQK